MTVREFFFTAAYAVWLYILLCLLGKLMLDARRKRRRKRQANRIRRFFHPARRDPGEEEIRETENLGKDLMMAEYACQIFLKNSAHYTQTQRSRNRAVLLRMLENAAEADREKTPISRCALISMARSCGIARKGAAREMSGFADGSELTAFWAETKTGEEKS